MGLIGRGRWSLVPLWLGLGWMGGALAEPPATGASGYKLVSRIAGPDGGWNGTSNTAVLFDGRDGRVIATLPVGKKPDAAVYDSVTHTAWVMDSDSGEASLVDPLEARVLGSVPIGGALESAVVRGARSPVVWPTPRRRSC